MFKSVIISANTASALVRIFQRYLLLILHAFLFKAFLLPNQRSGLGSNPFVRIGNTFVFVYCKEILLILNLTVHLLGTKGRVISNGIHGHTNQHAYTVDKLISPRSSNTTCHYKQRPYNINTELSLSTSSVNQPVLHNHELDAIFALAENGFNLKCNRTFTKLTHKDFHHTTVHLVNR